MLEVSMTDSEISLNSLVQSHNERVHVTGIRCFSELQSPRLGKITVLVGENSTGKSTFLAVTSMLSQLIEPCDINFNQEPFMLGSYRDIATIKTNKSENYDEFSIGLEGRILPKESPSYIDSSRSTTSNQSRQIESYKVLTKFVSKSGQPTALSTEISVGKYRLEMDWLVETRNRVKSISIGTDSVNRRDVSHDSLFAFLDPRHNILQYMSSESEQLIDTTFGTNRPESFTIDELRNLSLYCSSVRDAIKSLAAYAIAPVRSMPKRTYDPVQSLPMPEGRHVPMMLSQAFREHRSEWIRIKQKLEEFGELSGLFREISVRSLGESASDPFQLTVRVGDKSVNLLDVGYGVSQILPIIVDTLTQSSASVFLLQQPEVHLHPRGQAALASYLLDRAEDSNQKFIVETHSDQIIDRLRIEVRDRKLDPRILSLLYFEQGGDGVSIHEIDLDAQGNLTNAPSSYRDFFLNEEYSLLGILR